MDQVHLVFSVDLVVDGHDDFGQEVQGSDNDDDEHSHCGESLVAPDLLHPLELADRRSNENLDRKEIGYLKGWLISQDRICSFTSASPHMVPNQETI